MKRTLAFVFAALIPLMAAAQPARPAPSNFTFTTDKEIPITSVKNQYRSGTCWCFSALSFLESEVIKAKNLKDEAAYPDFSEMFIIRHAYMDRAWKYVRLNGHLNMAAGSGFGDVLEVVRDKGLITQEAY